MSGDMDIAARLRVIATWHGARHQAASIDVEFLTEAADKIDALRKSRAELLHTLGLVMASCDASINKAGSVV